jgi:hypothetical protein
MEGQQERQDLNLLTPIEFGDYLIERKILDEGQLLDVLAEHWLTRTHLADSIVRRGYLERAEVERLVAEYENLQVVYV